MQLYELMYIIRNDYTDEQVPGVVMKLADLIGKTAPGSSIRAQSLVGRRKLAYRIKHEPSGYYGLIDFEAEPKAIKKLNQALSLTEGLLRHIVVKKVEKSAEELAREEALREKIHAAETRREKGEMRKKPARKVLVQKREELPQAKKASPKTLEQIEEKLDEILKRDIVE